MLGSGESRKEAIRPDFSRAIRIDFLGATISSDTGFILLREVDERFRIIDPLIPSCDQKSRIVILSAAKNLQIRDSSLRFAPFRMTDQYYFFDSNLVLSRGGPPRMGPKLLVGGGPERHLGQAARLSRNFLCSLRSSILR